MTTKRHDESGCQDDASVPPGDGDRCVGRRSYLKLAGATAGSASLLGRAAGARAARTGDAFSQRVNAVKAGCDPTGRTPSDRAFQQAVAEDTLLTFPAGTYRFTEPQVVLGFNSVGLLGEGEVSFAVPPGFDGNLLTIAGGSELLLRGIDIDMTAASAVPGLRLGARDRLLVEDVEFRGRGVYSPGDGPVANALSPVVRSPDGVGIIRNVRARNDGPTGPEYRTDTGRAGIRIGGATRGTVTIADCHLQGFQNGGAYVSETAAEVRVVGGVYRDNDLAGIRIGGTGSRSTVENARVEAGLENATASDSTNFDTMNTCAIRFEGGGSGTEVRGCELALGAGVEGEGAVVAAHDYGGFTLRDTRIQAAGGRPAIRGLAPHGGPYSPPRGSLETRFERCSILGPDREKAVRLTERPAPRTEGISLDGTTFLDPL
ncbi:hypothetical protein BRC86_12585 [Halobacteriales archaeon QS_3_64_16]|nr:MAG: hypothetical protein BRC86_12585 [Halobacteriales archaeon QS_3_64_16]